MIQPDFIAENSTYFENLMRHCFTYELSRLLLLGDTPLMLSVSRSEIDDAGVDLVMSVNAVTRSIQMKALARERTENGYAIAESLLRSPGGCVLWVCYSKETLEPIHFHLFDCGTNGLSEEAIKDLPQATKRKKTGKVARKGYRQLRIEDAQHQDLDLPRLANRLFNL